MLGLLLVSLVVVWLWTGGISKSWNASKIPTNLIDQIFFNGTSTGKTLRLPWQPTMPSFPTAENPDQSGVSPDVAALYSEAQGRPANLYDDASNAQIDAARNFGNPSPFRGQVNITQASGAQESSPSAEYIVIGASSANTAPIDITGWSLQSVYTGARGYVPRSASTFVMGNVNSSEATQINPGATAIINSGTSPVGMSFRENICSGYLAQFQSFYPSLSNSCPSPSSQLALNAENLRTFGETCFDFVQSIPSCTSPFQSIPSNISPNCRTFALNNFSYNGCVSRNFSSSVFALDSWRIYLGSGVELWRNSHDVIRLLDNLGRTVDVLTY